MKDTRTALVEHFADGRLVHPDALLAPSAEEVRSWVGRYTSVDSGLGDADDVPDMLEDQVPGGDLVDGSAPEEETDEGFREAAE